MRCFTAELSAPESLAEISEFARAEDVISAIFTPPGPAELEWARLLERTKDRTRLDLRDGFSAFEAAIERGDLAAARVTANQTCDLARQRLQTAGEASQVLRDVSIALDNLGEVERDLGNLEAAQSAWRESLEIARRLNRTFPNNMQYQRDLAWIEARASTPIEQA